MGAKLSILTAATLAVAGTAGAAADDAWTLRGTTDTAAVDPAAGAAATTDPAMAAATAAPPPAPRITGRATPVAAEQHAEAAVPAITGGKRRGADGPGPYEALGIRVGNSILYPSLEIGAGYTSNATATAGGGSSATLTVTPGLRLQSDWSRHEASVTLRGSFEHFGSGASTDALAASADATLRLDIDRDWSADLHAGYDYSQQELSDPNFPAGGSGRPGIHDITGGMSLTRAIGPLRLSAGVEGERKLYQSAEGGGGTIDQSDRDFGRVEGRLRVGYEIRQSLQPFVELGWGRQVYDTHISTAGYERDGTILRLRGGLIYDSPPVLTAEVSAGVTKLVRDDPALAALTALTFDGSIVWSPSRLVTVSLDASTGLEPATEPGSAGSILYDATLDLAYDLRDNLTVDGFGSVSARVNATSGSTDNDYTLGTGLTWRISRTLSANARYSHEWTENADASTDSTTDAVNVGLRLQR